MNKEDYVKAKIECLERLKRVLNQSRGITEVFDYTFDCAYTLGKQEKDAEGEEMLTVPRKDIVELYQEVQKTISQCKGTELAIQAIGIKNTIWSFFGSKCLPDEEQPKQKDCDNPLADKADKEGCRWRNDGKCTFDSACYFEPLNPQEPKFKLGDIVRFKYSCTPYRIDGFKMLDGAMLYQVGEVWAEGSDLEPYTEPEGNIAENHNLSQHCDKSSDNPQSDKTKASTNHFGDSNEMVNDREASLTKVPPNPFLI